MSDVALASKKSSTKSASIILFTMKIKVIDGWPEKRLLIGYF